MFWIRLLLWVNLSLAVLGCILLIGVTIYALLTVTRDIESKRKNFREKRRGWL